MVKGGLTGSPDGMAIDLGGVRLDFVHKVDLVFGS